MSRSNISQLVEILSILERKVDISNSLNLQDININLENVFRDILNIIFKDKKVFRNLNFHDPNNSAIDLGDNLDECAFQITSTTTRAKVVDTISKYKAEYPYQKLIMLYCVINKPKREKGFETELNGTLELEEWDLTDLSKLISNCESHQIKEIENIILRDLLPNLKQNFELEIDESASNEWDNIDINDELRNLKDKITDVNPNINKFKINKYSRDIASGKAELSRYSDRVISAMKYRIFEACQNELIDFCDSRDNYNLSDDDIIELIEKYTDRAERIIKDKSIDYKYPVRNRDLLRKIILALIDECYLSFDLKGIYDQ